jgi:hypothetical protein
MIWKIKRIFFNFQPSGPKPSRRPNWPAFPPPPRVAQAAQQAGSPATAAIVARRPPKVSKLGSPSRTHAVGEVLVENRGSEGRIRPPTGVVPNRPLANQRPRLEPTVPLHFIKILPLISKSTVQIRSWIH